METMKFDILSFTSDNKFTGKKQESFILSFRNVAVQIGELNIYFGGVKLCSTFPAALCYLLNNLGYFELLYFTLLLSINKLS